MGEVGAGAAVPRHRLGRGFEGARRYLAAFVVGAIGCGGGAPLLHPAHTLDPNKVAMGAGVSGVVATADLTEPVDQRVEEVSVSPGVAPWVSGRMGIVGDNEVGLTYTGRSVRLDGRHAFDFGNLALSAGVGGSVLLPRRPSDEDGSIVGGGVDVPLLIGYKVDNDLYSIWLGPRGGVEFLRGNLNLLGTEPLDERPPEFEATHFSIGGLIGLRAGFRHVHIAMEVAAAYHRVDADWQLQDPSSPEGTTIVLDQFAVVPAGALVFSF